MHKMKLILPYFLALAGCLVWASAQALNSGRCPNPETTAPFDISQQWGIWYTIQRTEPMWSEYGTTCVQVNFTGSDDGTINADWKAKAWPFSSDRTWTDQLGTTKDNPSGLTKKGSLKYTVVEADDLEYLVLYSCNQYIPKFLHGDEIRILGRSRTMSRDTVMNIQRKLNSKGLRPKTLTYVQQTDCSN